MRYSNSTPVPELDPDISEKDYLAYLLDECELNSWCKSAFPDMLATLRSGTWHHLSEKQRMSVRRAAHEFELQVDIARRDLYRGYADRTDAEVIQNTGTGTPGTKPDAKPHPYSFDDMDDDIPF